jgi:hypothetical protein
MRQFGSATLLALLLVAGGTTASRAASIEKLAWLGGCWAAAEGEPGSGEHWMPLAGGTLLGVSRTVKRGRTVEHEFMQIRAGEDGRIAFIAQPSGQRMARFPVAQLADDEVVFENVEHDFPQRIIYRRQPGGRLLARIEGLRGGAARAFDFPFRRIRCDALGEGTAAVPAERPDGAAVPGRRPEGIGDPGAARHCLEQNAATAKQEP